MNLRLNFCIVTQFAREFGQLIHIKLIASIIRLIKTRFKVKNRIINLGIVMLLRSFSKSFEVRTPINEPSILLNHII